MRVVYSIWNRLLNVFYAWCHIRNKISRFGDKIGLRPQAEDKLTSTTLGTLGKTQKFIHVTDDN
jgi:hypothetical protein